ncbi:hypothetical protein QA860_05455 [Streptomyces stelliscabiei]|uniref:hypothetical protein n=1 Tax=Streptomyces stelliscabiei TaxID=146820 RepID=UPI002FF0CDAF
MIQLDIPVVTGDQTQTSTAVRTAVPDHVDDCDVGRLPLVDEPPAQQPLDGLLVLVQRAFDLGSQPFEGMPDFVHPRGDETQLLHVGTVVEAPHPDRQHGDTQSITTAVRTPQRDSRTHQLAQHRTAEPARSS